MILGSSDMTVRVFSIETGEQVWATFLPAAILSLTSTGSDSIAAGDSLGKLYLLQCFNFSSSTGISHPFNTC